MLISDEMSVPKSACQIENEYQHLEAAFKEEGTKYIHWAAQMAIGTNIGIPWIMCKQTKAPGDVVTFIFFLPNIYVVLPSSTNWG
jgi:hypothetical protein